MHPAGHKATVNVVERGLLHHEPFAYCAHPHMVVSAAGTFLLVFNRVPRREIVLHPPQDPDYRNVLMRSSDEGRSWSVPVVVPDYSWNGVECAGLTALSSGPILLNQWKFDWLPLGLAEALGCTGFAGPDELMAGLVQSPELDAVLADGRSPTAGDLFPWTRGGGDTVVHRSDDDGRSFTQTAAIDTAPYSGGYGMRGAIELPDGDILLPLSDVPNYRSVFTVRSTDGGQSWSRPAPVAEGEGHEFEEPSSLRLPSGRILLMLRDNGTRVMHSVVSDDGGHSWSPPVPTGITAYPAQLLALGDGRIACIAGRREKPFGIVLHLSSDDGASWNTEPIPLVDDLPTRDLGYPTAVLRSNGDLFIVYYARLADGVTAIHKLTVRAS
jgi:hypothetical protein